MCLSFRIAALYEIMMKWSRRRRKVMHAPEIPEDLLIEILTRLPAKSVMRFKCISKFWSSLLSSRYLCNRYSYLTVSSPPQARLYMSSIDHSESESILLISSPTTASPSSSLVFNQTIREMGGFYTRVLRGFICFTLNDKPQIYNPTTRQLIILPDIASSDLKAQEGLGNTIYSLCHDSIHDQYKILCTISKLISNGSTLQKFRSEHWIYLLEAGGSWTRVAKEFPHHYSNIRELTMDGVLYYLAWTDFSTCVLVSFDMSSEEFNMIQLPHHIPANVLPFQNWRGKTQINYDGKVTIIDFTDINVTGSMDLWILEDWKKEEWLKKTLVVQPSQMHLLTEGIRYLPKNTTLKGKVILTPDKLIPPHYILCYDLQTNHLEKIDIEGIPKFDSEKYVDMAFIDVSESIVYLQT